MDKKLPKVFANKINKNLENNENYFYSASRSNNEVNIDKDINKNDKKYDFKVQGDNVTQKINSIFSSPKYVYKADVDITLKSGIVKRRIIGKNMTHLITIDNELIPISDVIDIDFSS